MLNVNVTIEVRSLVSEAAKHFKLTMASRWAALSGNTSLIVTFSSYLQFFCWARHCHDVIAMTDEARVRCQALS